MPRTTEDAVQELLEAGGDYDLETNPSLIPFIQTANVLVSRVRTCAINKGTPLSVEELELIERWMAAHYYTKSDRVYSSKATEGASGAFVLDPETPEPYKRAAMDLDFSGCLSGLLKGARASMTWLGKPPSEQTDYRDRD